MKKAEERDSKIIRIAGLFIVIFMITIAAVFLYSPIIKTHASDKYIENSANKVNAKIQPIVAMTISTDKLRFEMNPISSGSFKSLPLNVSVTTNNPSGYEIYMSALDSVDLTNETTTDKVASLTESVTSANMPVNTWGYSLDNTTFHAIPSIDSPALIAHTDDRESGTTTINYGVKVDTELEMVTYGDTLVITAIPNGSGSFGCGGGFFCIEYMQEMTPEICAETTTPLNNTRTLTYEFDEDPNLVPRTTLKDIRDNKSYIVTKLADGNCWMSEDLDLQLTAGVALDEETTDLNSKSTWTPTHSTGVLKNIDEWTLGVDPAWEAGDVNDQSVKIAVPYPEEYNPSYHPDTADTDGIMNEATTLYTWTAASAGATRGGKYYNAAADSICPKGWQLPNHSWAYYYIDGSTSSPRASFDNLLYEYDYNLPEVDNTLGDTWNLIFNEPIKFTYATGRVLSDEDNPNGSYEEYNYRTSFYGVDDVSTGSSYYWTNGNYEDPYNAIQFLYLNAYIPTSDFQTEMDTTENTLDAMGIRCVARYEDN